MKTMTIIRLLTEISTIKTKQNLSNTQLVKRKQALTSPIALQALVIMHSTTAQALQASISPIALQALASMPFPAAQN